MIYINHNSALEQLKNIIDSSFNKTINYMPDNFNAQQYRALELLKTRVFLEEVVEESITFNKQLNWEETNKNLKLVNTAEELIEVFKLRSTVYTDIGYQGEFPDTIEGLNFDKYDKNAAILYYQSNNIISGTVRFILDSSNKLPSESKFSFDNVRNKYDKFGELSRFVIKNETQGLSLEFKYLTQGVYTLFMHNKIDVMLLAIIKEHYKLYSKFGGGELLQELDDYGKLGHEMFILLWNPALASDFFKRTFLK